MAVESAKSVLTVMELRGRLASQHHARKPLLMADIAVDRTVAQLRKWLNQYPDDWTVQVVIGPPPREGGDYDESDRITVD